MTGVIHALVFLVAWFTLAAVVGVALGRLLRENERPFTDDTPPAPLVARDWWGSDQ